MQGDISRSEYVALVRSWVEDYERHQRLELLKQAMAAKRERERERFQRQLKEQEGMWEEYRKQLKGEEPWPAHIDF